MTAGGAVATYLLTVSAVPNMKPFRDRPTGDYYYGWVSRDFALRLKQLEEEARKEAYKLRIEQTRGRAGFTVPRTVADVAVEHTRTGAVEVKGSNRRRTLYVKADKASIKRARRALFTLLVSRFGERVLMRAVRELILAKPRVGRAKPRDRDWETFMPIVIKRTVREIIGEAKKRRPYAEEYYNQLYLKAIRIIRDVVSRIKSMWEKVREEFGLPRRLGERLP